MDANDILGKVDELIEKIPAHIRDILQKASLALLAFIGLIAIIIGIQAGLEDAKPGGLQMAKDTRDLFYLQQLRKENDRRKKLVEDIDVDPLEFSSRQQSRFQPLGKDTSSNLMGERDSMLQAEDEARPRSKEPGYLEDQPMYKYRRGEDPDSRAISEGKDGELVAPTPTQESKSKKELVMPEEPSAKPVKRTSPLKGVWKKRKGKKKKKLEFMP